MIIEKEAFHYLRIISSRAPAMEILVIKYDKHSIKAGIFFNYCQLIEMDIQLISQYVFIECLWVYIF